MNRQSPARSHPYVGTSHTVPFPPQWPSKQPGAQGHTKADVHSVPFPLPHKAVAASRKTREKQRRQTTEDQRAKRRVRSRDVRVTFLFTLSKDRVATGTQRSAHDDAAVPKVRSPDAMHRTRWRRVNSANALGVDTRAECLQQYGHDYN